MENQQRQHCKKCGKNDHNRANSRQFTFFKKKKAIKDIIEVNESSTSDCCSSLPSSNNIHDELEALAELEVKKL